jgi:hypothetical protein
VEVALLQSQARYPFLKVLELFKLGGGLCLVILESLLVFKNEAMLEIDLFTG